MLQTINDKAKGWLAYLIVGLISIPFALFGISSYLGSSDKLIAATVNGEEIPVRDVQNALLQQKQRLSSLFGGQLPPSFSDSALKSQALEGLINQALIRQKAEDGGYRASDKEVFAIISETPSFQKEGVFDKATYEKLLKANRRNKIGYETALRVDISNRQFSDGIYNTSFLPATQLAFYQALANQVRDFEIFTLKLDDYKEQVKPTEDEIKAYYKSHSDQYMTDEKIKIASVRLKLSDLAESITVTPELLQAFYDEDSSHYIIFEQRKIARILFKVTDGKEKEAKKRAEALRQKIVSGAISYDAAMLEKTDNVIATDMGFLAQGDMGAAFEKVAFALKKDELSAVTKTESGYELLKVSEIKPQIQQTFEQAKESIEKNYRQEKAEKLFQEQVETLSTVAFENDTSLEPAAQSVGLEVDVSDWFTKAGGKELTANPKILAEAFSEAVFTKAKNSSLIEISNTDVIVIRLQEKQLPVLRPLADVSEDIKLAMIDAETRKIVIKKGEALLAKLKSGGDWSVLSDIGATVDAVEKFSAIERKAAKPSVDVVRKVFAMTIPQENKSTYSNTIMPKGDYVLISLKKVKEGDSSIDEIAKNAYVNALAARERSAVMGALRSEADVVITRKKSE